MKVIFHKQIFYIRQEKLILKILQIALTREAALNSYLWHIKIFKNCHSFSVFNITNSSHILLKRLNEW